MCSILNFSHAKSSLPTNICDTSWSPSDLLPAKQFVATQQRHLTNVFEVVSTGWIGRPQSMATYGLLAGHTGCKSIYSNNGLVNKLQVHVSNNKLSSGGNSTLSVHE
jgi:hypothetical protein